MKRDLKRIFSIGLVLALLLGTLPAQTFAAGPENGSVSAGTYRFTSNELSNIQLTDTFEWRDDCFRISSFEGCDHLKLLSAQASIASASRYGDQVDRYEVDHSDCGQNIKTMLSDMGFQDVSTNKYYQTENLENSAAVAVGQRTILDGKRKYTLLAIIPRSAGYKQEWAGNFTVAADENDRIHRGFKAGRDEILRFVKNYIEENEITGDLKVWIAGHSRGSALANLLGGFFAGGGIAYFGNGVRITPEDVYCYAFATPKTIIAGLPKSVELSVEGNRDENRYAGFDSVQDPYFFDSEETVDPEDPIYGGIRNFPFSYDFITYLPPLEWDFTYYGSICSMTESQQGPIAMDDMVAELGRISDFAAEQWKEEDPYGDVRSFSRMDFDLAALETVPIEEPTGAPGMTAYVEERIHGLSYAMPSLETYCTEGYQEMFIALAGLYGTVMTQFPDQLSENADAIILPAVLCTLSYASKCLIEEGRAKDEAEAVTIALVELADHLTGYTGENVHDPKTITVDGFLEQILKYLVDHKDSKLTGMLIGQLTEQIGQMPDDFMKESLMTLLDGAVPAAEEGPTLEERIFCFVKACVYGPEDGTMLAKYGYDAKGLRGLLCFMASMILPFSLSPDDSLLSAVEGSILPALLRETGEDGEVTDTYEKLGEAADTGLRKGLDQLFGGILEFIESEEIAYPPTFISDIEKHKKNLLQPGNITCLREVLCHLLFCTFERGEDGSFTSVKPYDTVQNVQNAATFIGNVGKIPPAHYNEVFVAWGKAGGRNAAEHPEAAKKPSGSARHDPEPKEETVCPLDGFDDADRGEWYHDGVHYVLEKKIMEGLGNRKFAPDDSITRAMIARILWNMEGKPAVKYEKIYTDVPEGKWYTEAVSWVNREGIMKGYGGGAFGPEDTLTREQLVTVLYRYAGYKGIDRTAGGDVSDYEDAAEISAWARDAFNWALKEKLVEGMDEKRLHPVDDSTRAQIATIIMRFHTGIGKSK